MDEKFLRPYDADATEDRIYKLWEESGFFNPDVCVEKGVTDKDAETFSIALPPPNVTGVLHLGHALEDSLQDAFVRYNRMRGKRTLWVPGTDHAAIATESKVAKELIKKEKKTRHDLGREKFLERVEAFARESHDTIVRQIKKLGASLDWSREAYTLDKERERAVYTAFTRMYEDGLIYRGHRIVNWDPRGQTVISDDEVVRKEETTHFYYLKYGPFTISTARPETKFGDKYVVMHPDDKRYKAYKDGQKIDLEWINGPITATVVKDEAVDMDFGTGVMTITPWHDTTDFEIAERHNLDKEQIIDLSGKLLPIAGEFAGMHINKARPKIVEKLKEKGLLEKVDENYTHQLATAERTGEVVEPQIMDQWFVDVTKAFPYPHEMLPGIKKGDMVTLKKLMQHVVEHGDIEILPERFKKVYFHWINNLRDWNISRQIWFGHRIPAWYRGDEIHVGKKPKEDGWTQDPDTFDTWFSSSLWTFSTLGWPEETEDLKTYHPTSIIDPGYEIIFLWVARMILMSTYLLGEIPFKTVYLHGILRDSKGQKFSKSLGNNVDPLDIIKQYGTDALRMSLVVGIGPGNDSQFDEDKVRAYKKFANKLWNITRFILSNIPDAYTHTQPATLEQKDAERLSELETFTKEVTKDIESYRLYLAAEKLYHYVWDTLADVIIEERKDILSGDNATAKQSAQYTLYTTLITCLKLLHPFMPFITEEIWQSLPYRDDNDLIMVSKWPISL